MKPLPALLASALIAPIAALAEPSLERHLSSHWDSLRFALGILESDYYIERPVLVLYKTADGGILMVCGREKSSSRILSEDQTKAVVSRIKRFFAGAGSPPPSGTIFKPPAFTMQLAVDNGFARTSFFKSPDPKKDEELLGDYARFISELSVPK